MIFISILIFVALIIFSIGGVAGVSIYSYNMLMGCGQKSNAELELFIGICIILSLAILFLITFTYSKGKNHVLSRIIKLARVDGYKAFEKFKEFGKLGRKIQVLFKELLDANEKRTARIVFLDNTIQSILNTTSKATLLVDALGTVQYISSGYRKYAEENINGVLGSHIVDIYPNLSFDEILDIVETNHADYTLEEENHTFIFIPIYAKYNVLAGLYTIVQKNSAITKGVKQLINNRAQKKENETENESVPYKEKDKSRRFFGLFKKP